MLAFMGVGGVWQALECSNGSHQKCDSTQEKEQQIIFVESLSLFLSTQEKKKPIIFDFGFIFVVVFIFGCLRCWDTKKANRSLCLVLVMSRMTMVVKMTTLVGDDSDDEDMND